ncbi:MAG: tetratricopeptide repeat protein [Rhizobiaceae bacterium]|nr:tetratricopeptide repeat protein [Rhizobiaceae bacterium]
MNQWSAYPSHDATALPSILSEAADLIGAGNSNGAIAVLLSARQLVSSEPVACNTLAFLLLQVGRPQDAIPWFDAALALKPDYAHAIGGLGMACQAAGDFVRALQCYAKVLARQPDDAKSWYHQGVALAKLGRSGEALLSLDRAIALKADYGLAFAKRGQVLELLGDFQGATVSAARGCQLSPGEVSSWLLLGDLLQKYGNVEQAIAAYDKGLALSPNDFYCLCNKAQALKLAKRPQEAMICARQASQAEPTNREALLLCGNLELELGNLDAARLYFLALARMGIARTHPSAVQPAKFRALMLFSPAAGNTPYEDLIKDSRFDADMLIVLPEHRYDPEPLRAGADVVVNLVSEADLGLDVISSVVDLVDALRKPVINHPRLILETDRETVARRLAGISGAVMPITIRIEATELLKRLRAGETVPFPLIVRHAGTHGGEMMELVSSMESLLQFADEAGDQALYLTDFVDYSSPDGLFRKYRFVFVGDEILPYHLAIGDGWKVHHASTRMAEVEWMRNEERAFLNEPHRVFGAPAMVALDAIRREIGLDYFGIDCAVDSQGRVVVFEVNASMLIHLHNEGFEYKTPHVMRIKSAFERLLERRSKDAG